MLHLSADGIMGMGKFPGCNEIIPRLYLGDICTAANKSLITKMGITDMITVELKPIEPQDLAPCIKRYLYIKAMDHPKQDLISHFEASYKFIDSALSDPKKAVYTHCIAGVSRSATLVIAYLMKSKSYTFQRAYDHVTKCRRIVHPNEGFLSQLRLYQNMGNTIDIANLEYRFIALESLIFEYRISSVNYYKTKSDKPARPTELITEPGSHSEKFDISSVFEDYFNKVRMKDKSATSIYTNPYKCAKCRTHLFFSISVLSSQRGSTKESKELAKRNSLTECNSIFIEPQPWMIKMIREKEGIIECGACKTKIGKYDWKGDKKCACKQHESLKDVSIFKIDRKKVDNQVDKRVSET